MDECDAKRFEEFLEMIRPYFKENKRAMQGLVNKMTREVGYFNYIMCADNLQGKELEYRRKIDGWLRKGSYRLDDFEI